MCAPERAKHDFLNPNDRKFCVQPALLILSRSKIHDPSVAHAQAHSVHAAEEPLSLRNRLLLLSTCGRQAHKQNSRQGALTHRQH